MLKEVATRAHNLKLNQADYCIRSRIKAHAKRQTASRTIGLRNPRIGLSRTNIRQSFHNTAPSITVKNRFTTGFNPLFISSHHWRS
jgi:hypothetical protein